ncbi:MAG: MBL fold metallo-hydrolase [Phycisphaerales bacterium]|nr:MBL fold metallo-hydrolase [Phycisphaerales bacterium]
MASQWSMDVLRAGALRLDGGSMFGVVPKALWSRMVSCDDQNRIDLQTNCLLLHDGTTRVLIETGFGDKWSDKERGIFHLERRTIVDALAEHEVEPGDIDHVIVSHLHFDHAAGLTRLDETGAPTLTFPNAEIIVQRTEWDDALANKSTMTRTYLRSHLDPIVARVRLVDGDAEVLPGIHVWPMVGHTWGQHAIRFDDGRGTVAFVGDVMPTVHHVGLAFSLAYDMLPHENMRSKRTLLEQAASEGWRLVLDHEPGPPCVTVAPDADRPGQFRLQTLDGGGSPRRHGGHGG